MNITSNRTFIVNYKNILFVLCNIVKYLIIYFYDAIKIILLNFPSEIRNVASVKHFNDIKLSGKLRAKIILMFLIQYSEATYFFFMSVNQYLVNYFIKM